MCGLCKGISVLNNTTAYKGYLFIDKGHSVHEGRHSICEDILVMATLDCERNV